MARKILLADDSVTAQNMGRKILADAGYEVVTVNNGSAALKKIAEARPDLIVLDVYMPGYSGLEVCQRLKENGETSRIPILLTVGKLEPFKPEEAKRVRAEGFIVKPFEASELLSALAKLEDKVVPRADSSKPGRFARTIAVVEEGRYDNTVAIDEDSGWKNRIAFPSKKKEKKVEPEDADDPAIYNPINKDLRTVVDHTPVHPVQPAKAEGQVDLGALAPEGLPKDVTPEEIAALAAAAAQVKGIIEGQAAEPQAAHAPVTQEAQAQGTTESSPQSPDVHPAPQEPVAGPVSSDATLTEEPQPVLGTQVLTETPQELPHEGATFATEKAIDEPKTETVQPVAEVTKTDVEVSATFQVAAPVSESAIAEAPAAVAAPPSAEPERQPEPEPATMAVAAGFGSTATATRWTAVPVPLAPEEAGIVLQDEMRKMYAAFVGASSGPVEPVVVAEQASPATEGVLAAVAEKSPEAETVPAVVAMPTEISVENPPAPPAAEPAPEAAAPPAETFRAVVKDFETVAVASAPVELSTAAGSEQPFETAEAAAIAPAPEVAPQAVEQQVAEKPVEIIEQIPEAPVIAAEIPAAAPDDSVPTTIVQEAQAHEPEAQPQPESAVVVPAAVDEASTTSAEEPKMIEPRAAIEPGPEPVSVPATVESVEAIASAEPTPGGIPDMAKKESEVAATTAAAWASWRRIRETGDPKSVPAPQPAAQPVAPEKEVPEPPAPKEEAAMAVAAGAEKAPEEVPDSSEVSPEIASIVDSVLADLRPKIVEEISRKLGKKK